MVKYKKFSKQEQFNRRFHHLNKDIQHLYSTNEVYKDVKPSNNKNIGGGNVLKSRFVEEFLVENDLIDNYDFVNDIEPNKNKEDITFLRLWEFLKSLNDTQNNLTTEQQEEYKNLLNYIYVKCLLNLSKISS